MRWVLFLLPFFAIANQPSEIHLNLFFNAAVRQARSSTKGAPPDSGFAEQRFILWDYNEDSPNTNSYQKHYADLFLFAVTEGVRKVIVFPKNPSISTNAFFQISNQNPSNENCFAFWVRLLSLLKIEVEILFESDAFVDNVPSTPLYSLPDMFYFQDLPMKMNWVQQLCQIIPGAITGVTIDPEDPLSTGNNGYQQVINYMDQYRFGNGLPTLKLGMTFGIDAKPMTFSNLDTFPINSDYITPPPNDYFPSNPLPTYRAAGNNVPLLNNVYLQAYEPDFTYVFRENLNPTEAADTFISALQDIPYKPSTGKITTSTSTLQAEYVDSGLFVSTGKITSTQGNIHCSYSGSNFSQEVQIGSYLDYNDGGSIVPIGQVSHVNYDPVAMTFTLADLTHGANVTVTDETFILSQFGVEIISGEIINTSTNYSTPNSKIGAIDGPIPYNIAGYDPNSHQFNFLDTNPHFNLMGENFLCAEVVMKWIYPPITPAIASGINFLLSTQYDIETGDLYFGNWSLDNFMSFVNRFTSQVSSTTPSNPIFTNSDGGGVALPNINMGIYDYYLLLTTNTNPNQNTTPPAPPNPPPAPANPWFPEFPLSP